MHNSKLVLMSLVMATVFAGSSLVAAQTAAPPANTMPKSAAAANASFESLDKHHHGYLVRSDIPHSMKNLRLHFDEADVNQDGRLSPAEYAQYNLTYSDNIETEGRHSTDFKNANIQRAAAEARQDTAPQH